MAIELFNTLGSRVEPLLPAKDNTLRMYCCGPTVYDYGHIGNFRTFVHMDALRRTARLQGFGLKHVMNITDVDDKIIRNAAAASMPISTYTEKFERAFFEDMDALRVERPEIIARATENIGEMVTLIQQLAEQDIAYRAEDGSWYFRIARFPAYGKLSGKDLEGIEDGARVDIDEYEKDTARDFALWKAAKPGEASWDTPLGTGRPGWHIECSAMATKHLGPDFDLHGGGEDLAFPHHENEIAQSECATHHTFARHWFHVRFLLVEGRKMSKSEGNFYTLRDLLLRGYRASSIRFLLLSVPYRHQMNFTFDGLTESANAIERLRTFARRMETASRDQQLPEAASDELDRLVANKTESYRAALRNDLNTAEARAAMFDAVRAVNIALDNNSFGRGNLSAIRTLLDDFDAVFDVLVDRDAEVSRAAMQWAEAEGRSMDATPGMLASLSITDEQVEALLLERTEARRRRNFARGDAIRNELAEKGVLIEDGKNGATWKRK